MCALFWWLNKSLPQIKSFNSNVRNPCVSIQAPDGTVLATYGDLFEEFIKVNDLPTYVVNAFLAIEDRRFYIHNGVDVVGLIRAAVRNFRANRIVQGGSTLTQQLAKNMLMSNGFYSITDRSIRRKLQELVLAIKLESRFSKQEILTLYLNRVYFGAGTYGIDAASRKYFSKPSKELTIFEAAVLAGILRAPSRYAPTANPQNSIERAKLVLGVMESNGFIDNKWREQIDEWEQSFFKLSTSVESGCRYFADWVYDSIPQIIGPIDRDLIVVTTLNPEMQRKAEEICQNFYEKFGEEYKFSQVAVVAMTPDGAVLSMVGGLDYGKSQFNRATIAARQPGSAFKTFVYLTALEMGISPNDKFNDSVFEQGTWKPGNYKWKERGEISLFDAYVYSVNSVCIRVAKKVGISNVIKTARRLGITSKLNADLTLSIGAADITFMEMMRAYAAFFADGYLCFPYGIVEIRDKTGEILYQRKNEISFRVIKHDVLESMQQMMRSTVTIGTARAANVDPFIYGKTGSNSNYDACFFGGRPPVQNKTRGRLPVQNNTNAFCGCMGPIEFIDNYGVVVGVWVGNDSHRKKMAPISTGGRIPTRIAGELLAYLTRPSNEKDKDHSVTPPTNKKQASSIDQLLNVTPFEQS
ncbi:MAG: transglycosylase domain-containing protein [Holosporales bacterium]|nr:transglycosylase domain-containing protein [Holosporales bacterium]